MSCGRSGRIQVGLFTSRGTRCVPSICRAYTGMQKKFTATWQMPMKTALKGYSSHRSSQSSHLSYISKRSHLEDGHPELEHVHIEITVIASEGDLLPTFRHLLRDLSLEDGAHRLWQDRLGSDMLRFEGAEGPPRRRRSRSASSAPVFTDFISYPLVSQHFRSHFP